MHLDDLWEVRSLSVSVLALAGTLLIMSFTRFNEWLLELMPFDVSGWFKSGVVLTVAAAMWFVVLQFSLVFVASNVHRLFSDATVVRMYDARLARDAGRYITKIEPFLPAEYKAKGRGNQDVDDYAAFQMVSIPLFFESDNLVNYTATNRDAIFAHLNEVDHTLARNSGHLSSPQRDAIKLIFDLYNAALALEAQYTETIHLTKIIPAIIRHFIETEYALINKLMTSRSNRDSAYRTVLPIYRRLENGQRISRAEATRAMRAITSEIGERTTYGLFKRRLIYYWQSIYKRTDLRANHGPADVPSRSGSYETINGRYLTRVLFMASSWKMYERRLQESFSALHPGYQKHILRTAIHRGSAGFLEFIDSPEFAQYMQEANVIRVAPSVISDALRYRTRTDAPDKLYGSLVNVLVDTYPPFRQALAATEFDSTNSAIVGEERQILLELLIVPWLVFMVALTMITVLTIVLTLIAVHTSERFERWGAGKVGSVLFVLLFVLAGTNINAPLVDNFQNSAFSFYADPDAIPAALLNWLLSFLAKFPLM
ncbi:hypothetical protein [Pseudidiomarina atlantica]|nr:hypothetical protein [Pseudidiomarina atlantica]